MEKWEGKVAVVTGTSSGIGTAIAKHLVDAGVKVVGLGRRKDRGEKLASTLKGKGKFYPREVDITKENEVLNTFRWIKENFGSIHILINNAGLRNSTTLIDGDTKMWKDTLDTNVLALCVVTREAIKNMRENDVNGHIVHINSMAGHRIPPPLDSNIYPASKYAVTALTETLRRELNALNLKIKISSVSPGFVQTEMVNINSEFITNESECLLPEDIASAVIYILSTPAHVQVHDLLIRSVGQRC
ncbi:hypothetical protein FQR65_LT08649 [Abscondita terminalis]|nr:hypothetical protein FQR65_LT08649 [Abscondita terminalis]